MYFKLIVMSLSAVVYFGNGSVLNSLQKLILNRLHINGISVDETSTPISLSQLISNAELKATSEAIFQTDTNNVADLVTVNYQGQTKTPSKDEDLAPKRLIRVQDGIWKISTIAALRQLFDNYEQNSTYKEFVTSQEITEENEFLTAIMGTPVMDLLMKFLNSKGLVSSNADDQRSLIKTLWFDMYPRSKGSVGSSGFEHVFLSEFKKGKVLGLHNWIYFYTQEEAKHANYLGYLKKIDLTENKAILKFHLILEKIHKPVDSMFIGTSPELEIALYSLCFLSRANKPCRLSLAGHSFNLRTHSYKYEGKNLIGSAFPEI